MNKAQSLKSRSSHPRSSIMSNFLSPISISWVFWYFGISWIFLHFYIGILFQNFCISWVFLHFLSILVFLHFLSILVFWIENRELFRQLSGFGAAAGISGNLAASRVWQAGPDKENLASVILIRIITNTISMADGLRLKALWLELGSLRASRPWQLSVWGSRYQLELGQMPELS